MLVLEIVLWSILTGLWIWLQIWNVQLNKINKQLQKQLFQVTEKLAQYESMPSQVSHTHETPLPSHAEQAEKAGKADNTSSPPTFLCDLAGEV